MADSRRLKPDTQKRTISAREPRSNPVVATSDLRTHPTLPTAGGEVDSPTIVAAHLIALQRHAGNAAVNTLLGAAPTPQYRPIPSAQRRPAGTATALAPRVVSWQSKLTRGGLGPGETREMRAGAQKVFVGDRMTVTAVFAKISDEQKNGIVPWEMHLGDASTCDVKGGAWNGSKLTWEVTFLKVGPQTITFDALWTATRVNLEGGDYSESFVVVTDLIDFVEAVQSAQSRILGRFASARARLNEAAIAFRQAQADQDAALHRVASHDEMIDQLLWGALFAGVGGAAGGAVGGALRGIFEKWRSTAQSAAAGALTDAAKDTVKFAVRSVDKMRTAGKGGAPLTAGDSTSPTSPTALVGGEHSAAGANPLDFLAGSAARVERDEAKVQAALTQLIQSARQSRAANTMADFDEDPFELATRKSELDDIASGLNTEKKYYLKELWRSWLGAYSYKLEANMATDMEYTTVEDRRSRQLKSEVRKAAEQCGEEGDTWLREFAEPQRVKYEAEAAKRNAWLRW